MATTPPTPTARLTFLENSIMTKNRILSLFALCTALAGSALMGGCEKENDSSNTLTLTIAPYDGASKVYIDDDGYSCWDHADQVYINSQAYSVTIDNHTCRISGVAPNATGGYTAVFPASIVGEGSTLSGTSITGLTLPTVQEYQVDGFGHQKVPSYMAAYLANNSGTIEFNHAGIALQLNIANNYSRDIVLSQVVVSDNLAPLSGTFGIDGLANGVPQLVAATGSTDTSVTLNINDGIELASGASTSLTLVLPPTDAYTGNKFTIRICGLDKEHLQSGVSTLYEFTHRQNDNATGSIPRNIIAPVPVELNSPHTLVLKGLGTAANPYKIYTPDDLHSMQLLVNGGYRTIGSATSYSAAQYKLMNNIDMTGHTLAPIGIATHNFSGKFYGCGHTISNINVEGYECAGLFGYSRGTIDHLDINNATLTISAPNNFVCGALCGNNDYLGKIYYCRIMGTVVVNTTQGSGYIGGVIGMQEATANNIKFGGILDCHNATNRQYVGGIVGHNSSITENIYVVNPTTNNNILAGNATAGGIAGCCNHGILVCGYFGANNTVSGWVGHTADICGYTYYSAVRYFAYPNHPLNHSTDDHGWISHNYPYTPNGSNIYRYNNYYRVVNLLNNGANSYQIGANWSASDDATPPELDFTYTE